MKLMNFLHQFRTIRRLTYTNKKKYMYKLTITIIVINFIINILLLIIFFY